MIHPDSRTRGLNGLADADYAPMWWEGQTTSTTSKLTKSAACDLLVVGGGFSGLWAAFEAVRRHPRLNILLIDGEWVGHGASGRNGGFVSYSLTHGLANGLARWPDEMHQYEELGLQNLASFKQDIRDYGLDCDLEDSGKLQVATQPHQLEELAAGAEVANRYGRSVEVLSERDIRKRVDSPTFIGGTWDPTGTALIDPYRLASALKNYLLQVGVRIHEHTPATGLKDAGSHVQVQTPYAEIGARTAILTTGGFPSPLMRLRKLTIPVYDYAIATEPLSEEQLTAVSWSGREGLTDSANQFHYSRLTRDNRILWGGYDAIYYYGSRTSSDLDYRPATFEKLAAQFFDTFPQLDIQFSHAWGGVLDTSSRFLASYGTALGQKLAYVTGHTGLGVGASRFAADVLMDLLDREDTERTRLSMVKKKALPFPPEPIRALGINITRNELARSDRNNGKRSLWLKTLDKVGMGFDS